MTTSTDERRADVIAIERYGCPVKDLTPWYRKMVRDIARAIRESGEAAGMVLVPREATAEMLTEGVWDISPWHPAYDTEEGRKAAMRDAWNGIVAAATETPDAP